MAKRILNLEALINPTERQREFLTAIQKKDFVLYGGAAGGGKSYILRWWLVFFLCWLFKAKGLRNVQVGLFCEDYPSLNDRHISKIQFEFPRELGTLRQGVVKNFQLRPEFGGGIIALRNLDDPSKYLSSEFAAIAVDELTKNKVGTFDFLRMRLRWPGVERPKFGAGSNPGGAGHAWVKSYWLDHKLPKELEANREQFAFVKAMASDNPHLSESYYEQLKTLPSHMARAYAEGSWDIFAGQYFTNWERDRHAVSLDGVRFDTWCKRWISFDWGFGHSAVATWHIQLAVNGEDGKEKPLTITYREYERKGLSERALAEEIIARNNGDKIEAIYGGHDLWREDSRGSKESEMSKVFVAAGLPKMQHAKIERVNGWRMMHRMLDEGEWVISEDCPLSMEAIPAAVFNDKEPSKIEDVLKTDDVLDDVRDSLRYGIYSQFAPNDLPWTETLRRAVLPIEDRTARNIQLTKLISEHDRGKRNVSGVNIRSSARALRYAR